MKSVFIEEVGGIEKIKTGEIERPGPLKEGEVRLRFSTGSLNHLDLWVLKGLPRVQYKFPHILGADFFGEILESKSLKWKKGDRVILYPAVSEGKDREGNPEEENLCPDFKIRGENFSGVFAEEIVAEEKYIRKAPAHLNAEEAAALPLVYLTAWQMIYKKAGLRPENPLKKKILVHSAGSGVSHALLLLLLSFQESQIAATSRSRSKLERWKKLGVETFISDEKLSENLKKWAGPTRISIIFDHTGAANFELNIPLLKNGGKLVTCGATAGFEVKLDLRQLYFRQLQLLGSTMGSIRDFDQMLDWVSKTKIRPIISDSFSFSEAQKAYQKMLENQQDGKIVLKL